MYGIVQEKKTKTKDIGMTYVSPCSAVFASMILVVLLVFSKQEQVGHTRVSNRHMVMTRVAMGRQHNSNSRDRQQHMVRLLKVNWLRFTVLT